MKKYTVWFLIGPPGIGKSTYVKTALLPSGNKTICSTDNIIDRLAKEKGLTYSQAFHSFDFKEIEKEFYADIRKAVKNGDDIIIDRTNMTKKGRKNVLKLFNSDYEKIAIVFDFSNREKLDKQLAKREAEENKHIPAHIVDKMINSFVKPTEDEFDKIINV